MDNLINSLSGPEAPYLSSSVGASIAAPSTYTGSLSGADESLERYALVTGPGVTGTGYTGAMEAGPAVSATEGASTEGGAKVLGGGRLYIGPESGPPSAFAKSPIEYYRPLIGTRYTFFGTMSKDVLNLYLDKVLHMLSLASHTAFYDPPVNPSPDAKPDPRFDPTKPDTFYHVTTDPSDHLICLKMIIDTGAKMVLHMSGFGSYFAQYDLDYSCVLLSIDTAYLHSFDPEIICHASLSESINGFMDLLIPEKNAYGLPFDPENPSIGLIQMFYPDNAYARQHGEISYTPHPLCTDYVGKTGMDFDIPESFKHFDYRLMAYDPEYDDCGYGDITKPEYQMWLFYLATRYIDAGCEALYMGDMYNCLRADQNREVIPGSGIRSNNAGYWLVVQKIRAYAKVYARRGLVLLDSHPHIDDRPEGTYLPTPLDQYYYDPDASSLLTWQRQLMLDIYSSGVYYSQFDSGRCFSDTFYSEPPFPIGWPGDHYGTSNGPVTLEPGRGMLNNDSGGLHPLGWFCSFCPYYLDYDYGFLTFPDATPGLHKCEYFDNSTWFANQLWYLRNFILIYTYYRVKCLDPFGHFTMPGRIPVNNTPLSDLSTVDEFRYESVTEKGGQQETIKDLWAGTFKGPNDWVVHNFTFEEVANGIDNASSNLIFVGDDKIFYIGNDGWIYGYVHIYDTWVGVSPSGAAHYADQSQAKSDLVASPNGTMLLYIGVDNYIHGFYIDDIWSYRYIDDLFSAQMIPQIIIAHGSLIFPLNNAFYYIGTYYGPSGKDRGNHIHGFQSTSGSWIPVSPSYSAVGFGVPIENQQPSSGALAYGTVAGSYFGRIYYKGYDGFLYYYNVHDYRLIDYDYVSVYDIPKLKSIFVDQMLAIQGNLAIVGNRIYFVGWIFDRANPNFNSLWVYCVIDYSGSWGGVSPSFSGGTPLSSQIQSTPAGNIAVSPDGNTIAYFGFVNHGSREYTNLCIYKNIDGVVYTFEDRPYSLVYGDYYNSLQFLDNTNLYYIGSAYLCVFYNRFEEDYCQNPYMNNYFEYA